MNGSGIYAITNLVNGKVYIGSATLFRKRWSLHKRNLRAGTHHCVPLQRAWRKYGEGAFDFIILEEVADRSRLLIREQAWMDSRPGRETYNMAKVAGSRLGMKNSPEMRAKISAANKGRFISEERRAQMRASALARSPETVARVNASRPPLVHTAASKAAISAKLKGIVRSAETRAKIGAGSKGRTHSPETTAKRLATRRANAAIRAASA